MQVRGVVEESRAEPLATFDVSDDVMAMRYLDGRMYIGLQNGQLVVVSQDQGMRTIMSSKVFDSNLKYRAFF